VGERVVAQGADVVGNPHPGGIVDGGEFAEGEVEPLREGDDEADDERGQRGENKDREVLFQCLFHVQAPFVFCGGTGKARPHLRFAEGWGSGALPHPGKLLPAAISRWPACTRRPSRPQRRS
jgi:hypothetical protein